MHSVSARKPLFMDESAHDWRFVRLGRELGWSGVALKTCKTQTGAILSLCWAKAHGMTLMVQDLSNPMLAQIPHVLWRPMPARSWASNPTACSSTRTPRCLRPPFTLDCFGAAWMLDLSSIHGPGFGYRIDEIKRELPHPAFADEI